MRTAITLSKTHAGKWALVAGPDVPMPEQKAAFRAFRASKSNPDFSEVTYQENDGHREVIRFLTPKAAEEAEKQAAKDHAESKKWDEESAKDTTTPERKKAEKEFADKTKAAEEAEKKSKK